MKINKSTALIISAALFTILIGAVFATLNKDLPAKELLKKADILTKADDQKSLMVMTLIDKDGNETAKKMNVWSKGKHLRLIKFTYPADLKGTGFLVQNADLENEKMYVYFSAFKKIKRIAGSAKGSSFMDSDFSYSDIGSSNYVEHFIPEKLKDDNGKYVLKLIRKKESDRDYDQLIMWITPESFVPVKIEYYVKKISKNKEILELRKILTADKIEKIGKYFVPKEILMEDVKKKHKTRIEFTNLEFDSDIPDKMFTERELKK